MNAAKQPQSSVIEALRADRQACNASVSIAGRRSAFHCPGIRFHRHLSVLRDGEVLLRAIKQPTNLIRCKKTGCAAAQENCLNLSPVASVRLLLHIVQQSQDVAVFRCVVTGTVRIEITIGALSYTPWQVHVQRQGRLNHA